MRMSDVQLFSICLRTDVLRSDVHVLLGRLDAGVSHSSGPDLSVGDKGGISVGLGT